MAALGRHNLRWLFLDETNNSPSEGKFFICGGLAMEGEQMRQIHDMMEGVRTEYGFARADQFKFQTASRPKSMEVQKWTEAKRTALERAADIGVDLFFYAIHHGIAAGQASKTAEYGLNAVIAKFDMSYLAEHGDVGVVCIDRVDPKFGFGYLRDRFQQPLTLPDGRSPRLKRVIHYSMSCDGASHISSLVDLAIGGMRYCVNAATGKGRDAVAEQLLPSLATLLWSKEVNGEHYARDRGFLLYPKEVRAEVYKEEYAQLVSTLTKYANGEGR